MINKSFEFDLDQLMIQRINKPIRDSIDVILLLIETFQYIQWKTPNNTITDSIKIIVNKMNRIFFIEEKKFFSVVMPFYICENSEGNLELYDSDVIINSKYLAILLSIFKRMKEDYNFDLTKYEEYLDDEGLEAEELIDLKRIVFKLLFSEYGYLRYEDDQQHENGDVHPRYHIDVNYSDPGVYKLGLKARIDFDWFRDFLDTTTQCKYIDIT